MATKLSDLGLDAAIAPSAVFRSLRELTSRRASYVVSCTTETSSCELASVTVSQVVFDNPIPYVILEAKDEKEPTGIRDPVAC